MDAKDRITNRIKGKGKGGAGKPPVDVAVGNGDAHEPDPEPTVRTVPAGKLTLPKLDVRHIKIRVVGDSELISHAWSKKSKQMMLNKQMGIATEGREPKDPERDYHDSIYWIKGGGCGFPVEAFKNAAVTACTSLGKAITKVAARQAFHVVAMDSDVSDDGRSLVRLEGEPHPREDMVRIGQGVADIRYRAGFMPWSCTLTIRYNARALTDEQVVNLFNVAGFAVGIGEWRPECDGSYGMFHVE